MPTLTGTLTAVTGGSIDTSRVRRAYVRAPQKRGSLDSAGGLVTTVPVPVPTSGELSLDLEPGPAILVVDTLDSGQDVFDLYVTADMTLITEALDEAAPAHERSWAESQMVQLRGETVAAAGDALSAKSDAELAAQDAQGHRQHVDDIRDLLDEAAQTNVAPYLTQTALNATYGTKGEVQAASDAARIVTVNGARLDVIPCRAAEKTGANARSFQRSGVTPGPAPGDYYAVWLDEYRNPRVAAYTAADSQFDITDLSKLVGNPFFAPATSDDHRSMSITRDQAGRLHIIGNVHGAPMRYTRSAAPDDIRNWETVPTPAGAVWSQVSYPQLIARPTGLVLIYRDGTSSAGDWYLHEIDGTTIGAARKIFGGKAQNVAAYPNSIHIDPSGRMHIWFMWRNKIGSGNADVGYVYSDDLGATMKTITGANVAVPVLPTDTTPLIETGEFGYMNQGGAEVIDGVPHAIIKDYSTKLFHFTRAGGQWAKTLIASGGASEIGRPGMVATSDGRGFALYRRGDRIKARQVTPTLGDEFELFPYPVGAADSGWEPAPDYAHLRATDELRMIVTPTKGEANQTSGTYPTGPGTWIGVYTVDLDADVLPDLGRALQAVPHPILPPQSPRTDKPLLAESVLYNRQHDRWAAPGGRRSTDNFPSARWYGAPVRFAFSGAIAAAALNITTAGAAGSTVEVVLLDASYQAIARTGAVAADTTGTKELTFATPHPITAGTDYYIGAIVWGSATLTGMTSVTTSDPWQQGTSAFVAVANPMVGWRSAVDLTPGQTNLNNLAVSNLAPFIAAKTVQR